MKLRKFWFKIKTYYQETGEFSAFSEAEAGTIIQVIIQYWFNETMPNDLDMVVIKNHNGQLFVIDHVKRGVFDFYFIPRNQWIYYHKKTDIGFMFHILELFLNDRIGNVVNELHRLRKERKFIRGDYVGKNFLYQVNLKGAIIRSMIPSIFVTFFMSLFLVPTFAEERTVVKIAGGLFVIIAVVVIFAFIALRQFIIHWGYFKDNRDIKVRLSRGDDFIHVTKGPVTKSIPKADVLKVTQYHSLYDHHDRDIPNDLYTSVEFRNGDVLNLTRLLVPQDEIKEKFANLPVDFVIEDVSRMKLKVKTNLDRYFGPVSKVKF